MNVQRAPHHVQSLRRLARVMDEAIRVPGTPIRFGLDALIGLLPGAGDVVTGAVSVYTLVVAQRLGASRAVLTRMAGNVVIDAVVGAIPLLGDLFDVGWKANTRNVMLLEKHLDQPAAVERGSRTFVLLLLAGLALLLIGMVALAIWLVRALLALL
jgi:hypothetical protein